MTSYRKIVLIAFLFISISFAHNVNLFVYPESNYIYVEAYYADGTKVRSGKITVFNKKGKKLLTGITDNKGNFFFPIPEKTDLKIVLEAGMGHRTEVSIKASALSDIKTVRVNTNFKRGERKEELVDNGNIEEKADQKEEHTDYERIKRIVNKALDKRFFLLSKEFNKMKNKIFLTEIIGGIGYIMGLMGIVMFFLSRKNSGKSRNKK